MRNSLRLAAVGAIAAASFATSAQAATTASANANAEILSSLTVVSTADLQLGQIAANTGGTVTVNADSTVASTGALISTGTRSPAAFDVVGSANSLILVTLPSGPVNLTRVRGTETMSLGGFNTTPNGAFQLDGAGAGNFTVGGTLTVGAAQVPGNYTGSFSVSVEYQ